MANPLALVSGLLAVTCFLLALFILKVGRLWLHRLWACFNISVGIWGAGICLAALSKSQENAFRFWQFAHAGGFFVGVFFYHVVYNFCEIKGKKFLFFAYAQAIFFSVLNFFSITGYKVVPTFGPLFYIKVHNFLYVAITILWFLPVIYGHVLLLKALYSTTGKKRIQIKYLLISMFIGFSGGIQHFLPVYDINVYPYGNLLIMLYTLIATYAIFKHKLLDIEFIIKKTLIFAGIFVMAMFVVSTVSTIMQLYVGKYWPINPNVSTLISVLLALALYRPTHALLVSITDKFLFQKKSEIKVILNRLAERIITIVDIEQIGKTILSTLAETLRLQSGMIFLQNKKLGNYRMLEHFGMAGDELTGSIKTLLDDPSIINYFFDRGMMVLNLDHPDKRIGLPQAVSDWLKISKSRVCIPLFINEDQFGLMALGKKKSDQEFTQEEMDFFPTIGSQASLAIRNARLIEAVLEEREAKIKAEHVAKRVKFARTIKHEQKNTLATMESIKFLPMYYLPDLKKAFKEQDEVWFDEVCEKTKKIADDLRKGIDKILDIAEASLGGMESGDQPFRRMSFKVIWEDAKDSSGIKDCDYETTMQDGFSVWVQYTPFERVLENLITNANDAMKGQNRKKLIQLNCSCRDMDGKSVAYFEFTDNGPGISKELRDKIFEEGFSTKPKPDKSDLLSSGYGQGLYVCKYSIENIHHGRIWVESNPGEGATFKFWIPLENSGNK